MKKSVLTFVFLGTLVSLFLNFKTLETRSFIFTNLEETPNLPVTPFDYSVEFPAHLVSDTIETGYEAGEIDTTSFDLLTDHGATLGRVLFYDRKLSALENISCGSCHAQKNSFAENKVFSEGISALTKRNSMNLNDLAWTSNGSFFWDMSQTDIHTMITLPLKDENEIGAIMEDVEFKLSNTDYYPALFEAAYGDSNINEERIVDAIVQFIQSINTFQSRFDQQANINFKDFTEEENEGKEIFQFACTGCHTEGGLSTEFIFVPTGEEFHPIDIFPFKFNNGLEPGEDIGAGEWHSEPSFDHLFKVPTLRNISVTAPYMHDGSIATLEEVIDHYSEGVVENEWTSLFIPGNGYDFDEQQKSSLLAFLNTLTDEKSLSDEKWSDPFNNVLSSEPSHEEVFTALIKPNPMFEQAVIEFENNNSEEVLLNVYSMDGKQIHQEKTLAGAIYLNKNIFSVGIYILELNKNGKIHKQKLVVQ